MLTGSSSRAPAAALVASVLLHAAGVSTVLASPWLAEKVRLIERLTGLAEPPAPTPPPTTPDEQPPPPFRLGVEDSPSDTLTWVGFATATDHSAPEGASDQSAMSHDPAEPAPMADTAPAYPVAEEAPAPTEEPPQPSTAPADQLPAEHAAPPPGYEDLRPLPETEPQPAAPATDAPVVPKPVPPPPQPPQPPEPKKPAAAPKSGPRAEKTDEEADATAVKKTAEYRNGRVQAGQGLDIKTATRPVFTKYTRVTALPRNPIVEISFDRTGKVKNARIVQSSGYTDVDEPILDAVHEWTAKGKELERLTPSGRGSLLKVIITMRFY